MNWYKMFYLMSVADRLQGFFFWFGLISSTISLIALIVWLYYRLDSDYGLSQNNDDLESAKNARRWVFVFWFPCIFFWFCWVATPSKKDAILIVAGGAVGQFVANDSSAQKLPSDVARFLRVKILEETQSVNWKEEIFPEKDTLKSKSKEELLQILKNLKK